MSTYTIYLLSIIPVVFAAYILWRDRTRKIPLAEFGIENVERLLKYTNEEYREKIWNRGWMTSSEWIQLNKKQLEMIDQELHRRGF